MTMPYNRKKDNRYNAYEYFNKLRRDMDRYEARRQFSRNNYYPPQQRRLEPTQSWSQPPSSSYRQRPYQPSYRRAPQTWDPQIYGVDRRMARRGFYSGSDENFAQSNSVQSYPSHHNASLYDYRARPKRTAPYTYTGARYSNYYRNEPLIRQTSFYDHGRYNGNVPPPSSTIGTSLDDYRRRRKSARRRRRY